MIWFAFVLLAVAFVVRTVVLSQDRNLARMSKTVWKTTVALAVLFALLSVFTAVPAGHVGIPIIMGRVQERPLGEGLNVVNPFAKVVRMSVRTETYTMSSVHDEGSVKGDDSIQALSADGLLMPLDITVAYRLVQLDAPWIYRSLGPDYVNKIVRSAARTAVREAAAGFTAQQAYGQSREQLAQSMNDRLTSRLAALLEQREDLRGRRGFIVEQVMIRNVQLPPRMKEAIEEKLAAEQQAERMRFVLDKERQEAERKRIEAQGIADFQKIVSAGISDQLLAWKGIEATQQIAHAPNTKIVIIGNPKNGLPLILSSDR